jgi:shikimate dehydrogenase
MHNYTFKAFSIPNCYQRIHLEDGEKLREMILENRIKGANVTVPHKEVAFSICDEVDEHAQKIGAINTIINKEGKLYGYNTDSIGFVKAIEKYAAKKVLIIGGGGTARAIAVAMQESGYELTLINRSSGRLEFFKNLGIESYTFETFEAKEYELVINTTSAGLTSSDLPYDAKKLEAILSRASYAVDVVYGKSTPFLELAKRLGKETKDGEDMLLYQGVYAFEHFCEHQYSFEQIEPIMRKGLHFR